MVMMAQQYISSPFITTQILAHRERMFMPTKKDSHWGEMVKSLKAQHPTWGAGRITTKLEQTAANGNFGDPPKERWVGKYLKGLNEDSKWPQEEREYREFYWPESMEQDALPWEASAAALELSRYFHLGNRGRPSIRLVKWFWRVTLAAPGAPVWDREDAASRLTVKEGGALQLLDDIRGLWCPCALGMPS